MISICIRIVYVPLNCNCTQVHSNLIDGEVNKVFAFSSVECGGTSVPEVMRTSGCRSVGRSVGCLPGDRVGRDFSREIRGIIVHIVARLSRNLRAKMVSAIYSVCSCNK